MRILLLIILVELATFSGFFKRGAIRGKEAQIVPTQHSTAVQSMMFALTPNEYISLDCFFHGISELKKKVGIHKGWNIKTTQDVQGISAVLVALNP